MDVSACEYGSINSQSLAAVKLANSKGLRLFEGPAAGAPGLLTGSSQLTSLCLDEVEVSDVAALNPAVAAFRFSNIKWVAALSGVSAMTNLRQLCLTGKQQPSSKVDGVTAKSGYSIPATVLTALTRLEKLQLGRFWRFDSFQQLSCLSRLQYF